MPPGHVKIFILFSFISIPIKQDLHTLKKRQGVGELRTIKFHKDAKEALGISITGGKEHGLPILISEIQKNGLAWRCGQLYVGDSIITVNKHDLRETKHAEAVEILSSIVCIEFEIIEKFN